MLLFLLQGSPCSNEKTLEVLGVRNGTWKITEGVPRHGASSRS